MRKKLRWVVWYPAVVGLVSTLLALPLAAESAPARGVWLASIDFGGGLSRKLVLELEERGDGRLIGYILGGTSQRTVVSGRRIGKDVNLELELKTVTVTRHVTIWGRLSGGRITGSATDGGPSRSIVLDPIRGILQERRFLLGVPGSSGPEILGEMAVALDDVGRLLAGTWVAENSCATWGCDGEITAFDEISAPAGSTTLSFKFSNRDGCADESYAELAFDQVTTTYSGWYQLGTCTGYVSGQLLGVRTTRAQSDHVSQILQGLGRLADDHESGRPFSAPHPSFSPDYLEYGHHLEDLLFLYNAENAPYKHIEATFNRVSLIATVPEPFGNFFGEPPPPFGAVFEERRSGTPSTGSTRITYVDTTTQERHPWLRVWRPESGRWVIYGSQSLGLDLPFKYSIGPKSLEVRFGASPDVGNIHVSPGSFGAHFEPLTGHGFGNAKIDFVGFFTASDADLTTLPDGQKGYFGGTGGSLLLAHRPVYISPADGSLTSLECSPGSPPDHLGESDWKIGLELSTHERLSIDLGRVAPNLVATLRDRGISIGTTCAVTTGNLITENIPISQDQEIGYPQVIAHQLSSHFDYFGGGEWFPDRPWVYMEFFLVASSGDDSTDSCYYGFRPLRQQQFLQAALTADMLDPDSQRYWNPMWPRYEWKAESRLCMAPTKQPTDFSDLYTRLGGWFETNDNGVTPDEIVSFAPIAKDEGTAYDPGLYDSRAVDMLVLRRKPRGAHCVSWPVPDGTSVGTTNCDSAGEILERTPDSLLIKWHVTANPYQRAAYILDPVDGLKISWGGFAARAADAILPSLTPGTACDGKTIVCYDHNDTPGF